VSDSTLRDHATRLAQTDSTAAEEAAARIGNPWYRAQAYAWVARYAADDQLIRLARESMDSAGSCDDPYQQAAASAWVVRALLERGRRDEALQMLEIGLHAVPRISSPARRSEALFLLYQAAFAASEEIRRSLLFALAETHDGSDHWRVARNFRDALVMAKEVDAAFTSKLARGRNDAHSAELARALERRTAEPRAFFW
jgi:hypothetical protein